MLEAVDEHRRWREKWEIFMKIKLCLFEGNCTSEIIFYWFLVFDHNERKALLSICYLWQC